MEATLERLIELLLVSEHVAGRSKRTIDWYNERLGAYVKWPHKRDCKCVFGERTAFGAIISEVVRSCVDV